MRLDEFKKLCEDKFTSKDYKTDGILWHAKQLCYCRYKVLNEKIILNEKMIVGSIVHEGVNSILGNFSKSFVKRVGSYIVVGNPDIVFDDCIVEIKFSSYKVDYAREHDELQLKIYLWMSGYEKGYLWYITPMEFTEFEVLSTLKDSDILDLISKPKSPMWSWECRYCSLYPCKEVIGSEV